MSNFPTAFDDDSSIYRVDDNISQIGTDVLNQLRSAVFNIEQNLGLSAAGSLSSLSDRLNVSLNPNGTIKASALTSIGLVTLPITNAQVGNTAGILESKLSLDYSTAALNTLIQANTVLLNNLAAYEAALETKVNSHISGGPASNLRHTASMIDINAVPSDSRDPGYIWSGLIDKDGYDLTANNVADALFEINTNLTNHQNQATAAHKASAISVDTSEFSELLESSTNVQSALQNIDNIELLQLGTHREVHHSNGVPNRALSLNLNSLTTIGSDGYNIQVVSPTPIIAHVAHAPPGISPVDNITNGDSIITFVPSNNTGSIFDAQFSQVKSGDIIRINYGNGIEDLRRVESIKYIPGTTWTVRINGVNLRDTDGYTVYARIDRSLYDTNTTGVLAVAAANAVPLINYSLMGSIIISDPRSANAVGINFNPSRIGKDNYNLYLQLYPTGNPADHVINLPGIDVSGDLGASSGSYTLESIIQNVNNTFRQTGYNYRFIAHAVDGNFAITLADSIDGAAFAIISGSNSTGSLTEGTYVKNVIGDASASSSLGVAGVGLIFDALGFGLNNANLASPAYQGSWVDATAAQIPTKIIHPVKSRNYIVNGRPFDTFKPKPLTTSGFWPADINSRTVVGSSVEVTYKINKILNTAGLKPGKTIVVQPAVSYSDVLYNDVDYGRFIIKEVIFNPCECLDEYTLITVINGIHGTGNPTSSSSEAGLPVRLYFSEDSVSFDDQNIIDVSEFSINYHRFFEIYITDSKTTFSHERARMPYQSATGYLIDSNNFHINSVSPKFRGYRDSGTALNKYIRFYVLNYNSTTGEYDGYLGQRNPSDYTISKTGPIIRGKKNIVTRFYDNTNIDYIDLTFVEEFTVSPGSNITINPAYVDIELFDSMQQNGDLLLLASCEVNWNPNSGKNIVDNILNIKQIGSISEFEFTQSAKNYISAGERYLHGNGVIKGFDLDKLTGQINGGLALVNGKFAISNSTIINIPLCTNTSDPPQFVNWVLCINETGNLIILPLTENKTQFFAKNIISGLTNYIDSVSFNELINRKDLTPLYVYETYVFNSSTLTILAILDIRKYVKNETSTIPLVWAGKDFSDVDLFDSTSEIVGHFNKIEQVINWINFTKAPSNIIKIKGNLTFDDSLDLRQIAYPAIFDGIEGGTITVKTGKGVLISNNIQLKNINFNWLLPGLSYAAGDNVNLDQSGSPSFNSSNGLIYVYNDTLGSIKNIIIDNCVFNGAFPQTQRPPYISFILANGSSVFENIIITNNKFFDNITANQCAIAMVALYLGGEFSYRGLKNILIENNISVKSADATLSNHGQSIIISSLSSLTLGNFPFLCSNVNVNKNKVGAIGYLISSHVESEDFVENGFITNGLNISDNSATFIGTLDTTGNLPNSGLYSSNKVGSGDVIIKDNFCSNIVCDFYPQRYGYEVFSGQSLLISGNKLRCVTRYENLFSVYSLENTFNAIYVRGFLDNTLSAGSFTLIDDNRSAQILNNTISYIGYQGNKILYDVGIFVQSSGALISNNIINGFNTSGISVENNIVRNKISKTDIIGNQLYNPIDTAISYIFVRNLFLISEHTMNYSVFNNSFDRIITGGSGGSVDNMIAWAFGFAPYPIKHNLTIRDNTNQTAYAYVRAEDIGDIKVGDYKVGYSPGGSSADYPSSIGYFKSGSQYLLGFSQLTVTLPPTSGGFKWNIPLNLISNTGKFVSAKIYYTQTSLTNTGIVKLTLRRREYDSETTAIAGLDEVLLTNSITVTPGVRDFIEISAPTEFNYFDRGDAFNLEVEYQTGTGSSDRVIAFEPLKYTFRY